LAQKPVLLTWILDLKGSKYLAKSGSGNFGSGSTTLNK
jgi:hypothetical protein